MSRPTAPVREADLRWRIHVPNLLEEILCNPGTGVLKVPLQLLGEKLHELAKLAIHLDDPRLHLLMMDLTLYEASDPEQTPMDEITATRDALRESIVSLEALERK